VALASLALPLPGCASESDESPAQAGGPTSGPQPEGEVGRVLELVNQARAAPRACGDKGMFAAVPPLTWDSRLAAAAQGHCDDMVQKAYFSHTGSDGSQVSDRVTAAGYAWNAVGENIAAGQQTADAVVQAWLESPGHCSNIMGASFTNLGVALTLAPGDKYGIYWTQNFGRPR
jgi:uncharacterized protein YkwD